MIFEKQVINIGFDADPNCPPNHRVKTLLALHDHYRAIEASGGVKLVESMGELVNSLNAYFENPKLDEAGREILRKEQVEITDGSAGKKIAEFIKGELAKL